MYAHKKLPNEKHTFKTQGFVKLYCQDSREGSYLSGNNHTPQCGLHEDTSAAAKGLTRPNIAAFPLNRLLPQVKTKGTRAEPTIKNAVSPFPTSHKTPRELGCAYDPFNVWGYCSLSFTWKPGGPKYKCEDGACKRREGRQTTC